MSTRCQIGYYRDLPPTTRRKPVALFYRHNDGGPESVLPVLADFLPRFAKVRGIDDDEYLMAQLLRFMMDRERQQAESWLRKHYQDDAERLDRALQDRDNSFLGYGICGDLKLHGDIDYLYCITPDGVQVIDVNEENPLLTPQEALAVLSGTIPDRFTTG